MMKSPHVAQILIALLNSSEVIDIHAIFYYALLISIPCIVLAFIPKYRKKALIPVITAFGFSTLFYLYAFFNLHEVIFLLETLISAIVLAAAILFYSIEWKHEEKVRAQNSPARSLENINTLTAANPLRRDLRNQFYP